MPQPHMIPPDGGPVKETLAGSTGPTATSFSEGHPISARIL